MAKAIEFRPQIAPAIEETQRKLDAAPLQHAEALLQAYRLLQTMHDTGTLDFVRGALGAGDTVLNEVVDIATSPQSTRAIRNLLIVINLLGTIDPEALHRLAKAVTPVLTGQQPVEPPSLFALTRQLFSKDVRRALVAGIVVLGAVGYAIGSSETETHSLG